MSETCTCHAIANAIVDQLDAEGVDINQSHVVQTLIRICKNKSGRESAWPKMFHNCKETIITRDEETKEWIAVKIKTVKEVRRFKRRPETRHVLVYRVGPGLHTVFVRKQLMLQGKRYECLNSWGDKDPYPIIEQDSQGNTLCEVKSRWKRISPGMCLCK